MSEADHSQLSGRSAETREIAKSYCPHCGGENLAAAIFCMWCGQAVSATPSGDTSGGEPALRPPPVIGAAVPVPKAELSDSPQRTEQRSGTKVLPRLLPALAVAILTMMLTIGIALGLNGRSESLSPRNDPTPTTLSAAGATRRPTLAAQSTPVQPARTAEAAGYAGPVDTATPGPGGAGPSPEVPSATRTPTPDSRVPGAQSSPEAPAATPAPGGPGPSAEEHTPTPYSSHTPQPSPSPSPPPAASETPTEAPSLAATAQAAVQEQTATAEGAFVEATARAAAQATATALTRRLESCPVQAPPDTFGAQGRRLGVSIAFEYRCRMGRLVAGEDGKWVVFDVEMRNTIGGPVQINPLFFTLISRDGRAQRPDNLAYLLLRPLTQQQLPTGRTAQGELAFYTKRDFIPAQLIWRDFEETVVVRLVVE